MSNPHYSGPISDHFDGERFFIPGINTDKGFGSLLKWQFGGDARSKWPSSFPSPFAGAEPAAAVTTAIHSTLIGHASYLIQVADLNILVDPVYSERVSPVTFAGPKRVNAPGVAFEELPKIDVVLVTHSHYDHLDTATLARLSKTFRPRIICPLGNDAIMASAIGGRDKAEALDWGQSVEIGQGVTVHLVPTYHWSARGISDRRKSLWCSFVITTPAGTIYHIGDTGYGQGKFSKDVASQFGKITLAHIPIGAYAPRWFMKDQHVNPEEAVQIFQDCGAHHAIGHHWGTFQLTNEATEEPAAHLLLALDKAKISRERFQAFRPGQSLQIA
jgi:L-ascorbate metabolism protein UlaG (beta-lactamase superfamily)